ncbi:MAG: hypothetical protein O3A25_03785 [Acidobacteria bacterium]|nr:hypothetical protein [Acidobacteriota bacterium]
MDLNRLDSPLIPGSRYVARALRLPRRGLPVNDLPTEAARRGRLAPGEPVLRSDPRVRGCIAPALVGSSFFFRWSDLSVGDMYTAIRTTMPQGAPASLSPAGYVDIAAFLLQKNKVPAGTTELPTNMDDLEGITITDAK